MSSANTIIAVAACCCGSLFAIGYVVTHRLRRHLTTQADRTEQTFSEKGTKLDSAIEAATLKLATMSPLTDLKKLEGERGAIEAAIAQCIATRTEIEAQLLSFQNEINEVEKHQSEMRQSQSRVQKLTDEICQHNEELVGNASRLERELSESKLQVEALSVEIELSGNQAKLLEEVTRSLTSLTDHLSGLAALHQQTLERYKNLEQQFGELETEYRKLVAVELEGSSATASP